MDSQQSLGDDLNVNAPTPTEAPRHGFRGHPRTDDGSLGFPASVSIAISRESGSRGASIAQRVGARLGWEVYRQEMLEYIAQESSLSQELANQLTPAARQWIEVHLQQLLRQQNLNLNPSMAALANTILGLGVQGDVVLLGRGAGCILPSRSTLHVRLFAPLADRVAYTAQWLRLTEEEAAQTVSKRDAGRAEFLTTHFHRAPDDTHQYDMLLNTSLLGEECCADLICQAAQAKKLALHEVAAIS